VSQQAVKLTWKTVFPASNHLAREVTPPSTFPARAPAKASRAQAQNTDRQAFRSGAQPYGNIDETSNTCSLYCCTGCTAGGGYLDLHKHGLTAGQQQYLTSADDNVHSAIETSHTQLSVTASQLH
jgi:hypothetical protein